MSALCLPAVTAALVLSLGAATAVAAPEGRSHTPASVPPSGALVDGCPSTVGPPPRLAVSIAPSRGESATSIATVDDDGGVSVSTRVVSRLARPFNIEVRVVLGDVAGRLLLSAGRTYRVAAASAMRVPVGRPRVQADAMRFRLSRQQRGALAWIALCQRPLQEARAPRRRVRPAGDRREADRLPRSRSSAEGVDG